MLQINDISAILKKEKIKQKYGLKKIRLFGSYAKGTNNKNSDIDFLIDYIKPIDIVGLFALKSDLELLLGVKVDIINNKFLKDNFRKYIKDDLLTII